MRTTFSPPPASLPLFSPRGAHRRGGLWWTGPPWSGGTQRPLPRRPEATARRCRQQGPHRASASAARRATVPLGDGERCDGGGTGGGGGRKQSLSPPSPRIDAIKIPLSPTRRPHRVHSSVAVVAAASYACGAAGSVGGCPAPGVEVSPEGSWWGGSCGPDIGEPPPPAGAPSVSAEPSQQGWRRVGRTEGPSQTRLGSSQPLAQCYTAAGCPCPTAAQKGSWSREGGSVREGGACRPVRPPWNRRRRGNEVELWCCLPPEVRVSRRPRRGAPGGCSPKPDREPQL